MKNICIPFNQSSPQRIRISDPLLTLRRCSLIGFICVYILLRFINTNYLIIITMLNSLVSSVIGHYKLLAFSFRSSAVFAFTFAHSRWLCQLALLFSYAKKFVSDFLFICFLYKNQSCLVNSLGNYSLTKVSFPFHPPASPRTRVHGLASSLVLDPDYGSNFLFIKRLIFLEIKSKGDSRDKYLIQINYFAIIAYKKKFFY
jgi:hypothetical protein